MNVSSQGWAEPQLFKLRIEDVELLDRAGAFEGRPNIELIEGVLMAVSPQGRAHVFLKNELTYRFRISLEALCSPLFALCEPTVQISPQSAPEPDVALTDDPKGTGYMPVASVALAIEVADTSLRMDLEWKCDLYARAGVPEYWVVDVNAAMVHRFHAPSDGRYVAVPPLPLAGPLASLTIPDLVIDGTGIL